MVIFEDGFRQKSNSYQVSIIDSGHNKRHSVVVRALTPEEAKQSTQVQEAVSALGLGAEEYTLLVESV